MKQKAIEERIRLARAISAQRETRAEEAWEAYSEMAKTQRQFKLEADVASLRLAYFGLNSQSGPRANTSFQEEPVQYRIDDGYFRSSLVGK